MKIAPTPWTATHDGHGGICLDDAQGRQIGFVSARPEQDAHAALLKAAPDLLAALQLLCSDDPRGGFDLAKAAIAKAVGAA